MLFCAICFGDGVDRPSLNFLPENYAGPMRSSHACDPDARDPDAHYPDALYADTPVNVGARYRHRQEIWMRVRGEHFSYWQKTGAIRFAGPFFDEDHQTKIGCLIVVQAADRAEAEELVYQDPLYLHGLYTSCEIHPWQMFTDPLSGRRHDRGRAFRI